MGVRMLRYSEPHRVFITERPHDDEHVQEYWIRNCTMSMAARAFELLKTEMVIPHIKRFKIIKKRDIAEREGYYTDYLIVTCKGRDVTEDNLPELRVMITVAFAAIYNTVAEWVGVNKFLNMKVWQRKFAVRN